MVSSRAVRYVGLCSLIALLAMSGLAAARADGNVPQGVVTIHRATDPTGIAPTFASPGETLVVTVAFNNPVSSTTAPEISISGADVLSSTTMSYIDDNTYTYTYTPSAPVSGTYNIYIDGGVGTDVDATPQIPAIATLPVGSKPTVSLATSVSGVINEPFMVTAAFSTAVTNVSASSFSVSNGSVDSATFAASPDSTMYTVMVNPMGDGNVTVTMPQGAGRANGIPSEASSNALVVTYDSQRPHISLSLDGVVDLTNHSSITLRGNSTQALTGITAANFTLTNATTSNVVLAANGTDFTATVTPLADGEVRIHIPTGSVVTPAGNSNIQSNVLVFTYDATAPVGTFTASSTMSTDGIFLLALHLSEPVTGTIATSSFTITNGSVTNLTVASSTQIYLVVTAGTAGAVSATFLASLADQVGNVSTSTTVLNLTYTPAVSSGSGSSGGGGGGGGGAVIPSATPTTASVSAPALVQTSSNTTPAGSLDSGQVLGTETYRFTKYLIFGSHGLDVEELQKIFITAKLIAIDTPTGYFGRLTEAAVKLYQHLNGIELTGTVGPITRASLNAVQ
ncbi:MAG: repeat protein [Candidatus Adlerbacteria bacterium]|nr:repeat protein [Candidatus Adlerbacteria bacterium]